MWNTSESVGTRDERTKPEALEDASRATAVRLLLLWDGGGTSGLFEPGKTVTLGRSSACDVYVDHASVSRAHARLRLTEPLTVEDLGSSNGVRVRGTRIPPHVPTPLSFGDIVELGSVVLVAQAPLRRTGGRPTVPPPAASADGPTAALARMVDLVAKSDISVLLLGETGAGKGATAERIHRASARASAPLVRLNCPAFPEALLESELFGYESGAFSGATRPKPGLIESAEGGPLFLDEIAEIAPATQAKLLGVLDSREVLRLGSVKPRRIDVRFVAATNRDLERRVQSGAFRSDLYFRLNGVTITVPPLRSRVEEIPGFATRFLEEACRGRRRPPSITDEAMQWLVQYAWPGNLRELKNVMERAAVLCTGDRIAVEHLAVPASRSSDLVGHVPASGGPGHTPEPHSLQAPSSAATLQGEVQALERRRVEEALAASDGNQTKAAKLLGLSRRSLISRIRAFGLPRPRKGRVR